MTTTTTAADSAAAHPAPEHTDTDTDDAVQSAFAWQRYNRLRGPDGPDSPTAAGRDTARLRTIVAHCCRAVGELPGRCPAVWPQYRTQTHDGRLIDWTSPDFHAEHAALGLWGTHQQGNPQLMHTPGMTLGYALRALFTQQNQKQGDPPTPIAAHLEDSISRRLAEIADSPTLSEVTRNLSALVTYLSSNQIPLDYSNLHRALAVWEDPERRAPHLREWASAYTRTAATTRKKAAQP